MESSTSTQNLSIPSQKFDSESNDYLRPSSNLVLQRKVLYYSDFDIDVSEWKDELDRIKLFSSTLFDQFCNLQIEV